MEYISIATQMYSGMEHEETLQFLKRQARLQNIKSWTETSFYFIQVFVFSPKLKGPKRRHRLDHIVTPDGICSFSMCTLGVIFNHNMTIWAFMFSNKCEKTRIITYNKL